MSLQTTPHDSLGSVAIVVARHAWREVARWRIFLPDLDPVWWSEIKLFSRLNVEPCIPGVDVADLGRTEFGGSMRVSHDLLPKCVFARLGRPVLSEGNEELLIAGESVLDRSGLARERGP